MCECVEMLNSNFLCFNIVYKTESRGASNYSRENCYYSISAKNNWMYILCIDRSLHIRSLSDGLLSDLTQLLQNIVINSERSQHDDGSVQLDWLCLIKSCLKCLWVLSTFGPGVRLTLGEDFNNLSIIFQGEYM